MTEAAIHLMNDESDLIRLAQSKTGELAFSTLVKRYQGQVRAFLFRLSKNAALADDLSQDTFILAQKKILGFRGDSSFLTWLLSIAYRCFLSELRRASSEKAKLQKLSAEIDINPGYYENISSEQLDLERALLHLSRDETASVSLCFSFGCSHSEAAAILNMPVGTVKTHIHRGKEKLKKALVKNTRDSSYD